VGRLEQGGDGLLIPRRKVGCAEELQTANWFLVRRDFNPQEGEGAGTILSSIHRVLAEPLLVIASGEENEKGPS